MTNQTFIIMIRQYLTVLCIKSGVKLLQDKVTCLTKFFNYEELFIS